MTDNLRLDYIHCGDAVEVLKTLPDQSINCIVTSPPYFGLRSYLPDEHPDKAQELGAEPTPSEYVAALVGIFREAWRVLRDDGVLWLNLGDSYASAWPAPSSRRNIIDNGSIPNGKREARPPRMGDGLKEKDLMGIPWRVAFALQDDGWVLRADVIWHKPNPMPSPVKDRPTIAHEYVFLFSKKPRYWYDADAVAEDAIGGEGGDFMAAHETVQPEHGGVSRTGRWARNGEGRAAVSTRNRRSVWTIEQPMLRLRSDLTPEQRAYVLQRIAAEGLR